MREPNNQTQRRRRVASILRRFNIDVSRHDLPTLPAIPNILFLVQMYTTPALGYRFYFDGDRLTDGSHITMARDLTAIRGFAIRAKTYGSEITTEDANAVARVTAMIEDCPQCVRHRDTWLGILASLAFLKNLGPTAFTLASATTFMTAFNSWLKDKEHLVKEAWEQLA